MLQYYFSLRQYAAFSHIPVVLHVATCEVRKREKIRNRYNQVPHLTQDTNGKVTNSQLDVTGQPFPSRRPQGTNKQTRTIA